MAVSDSIFVIPIEFKILWKKKIFYNPDHFYLEIVAHIKTAKQYLLIVLFLYKHNSNENLSTLIYILVAAPLHNCIVILNGFNLKNTLKIRVSIQSFPANS